jgi:hypothetical protein
MRRLLTKPVVEGRQVLREALVGPLKFMPEGNAYRFSGEVAVGQLLAGLVSTAPF